MDTAIDKYLAYAEFMSKWKQLNRNDRIVLQPHLERLQKAWKESLIQERAFKKKKQA